MIAHRNGFNRSLAATLLALVGAAFTPQLVNAQQVFVTTGTMGARSRSANGNRVTSRSVDAYSRLLGLDDDQAEIAKELHQQYVADLDEANQRRRAAIQALMEEFRESEDHSILQEKMPELSAETDKQTKSIEAALFGDLRLLLDDEQAARWERVERLRRRETTLKRGALSGETTDLISITEKVTEDTGYSDEIAEALDRYEMELDRALVAKEKALSEVSDAFSGMTMTFDLESMEKVGKITREAGVRVRDVNKRHARVIESLMSEGMAEVFRDETKRHNFPQVYKESRVERLLAAAQKLTDLESGQRTSVDELDTSYTRERGAADNKWSVAISKDDEEGGSGFTSGSMTIRVFQEGQDEDESPVAKARNNRRDLDERYEERLMAVLNPDQRERMPKPEDNAMMRGGNRAFISSGGGGHMVIEAIRPDRE